ncbi:MAG: preprotein translocase subunit YajC [Bacteroidia bacterium]|nr:preprotein translocase subunit YajC [Bacteroidia bacterium]MDW8235136.1 preprotein translocase subunit YajC [Bacteroidia bacterium]
MLWLDTAQGSPPVQPIIMQIVLLLGMFAIFYFFLILPQRRQQKKEQEFRNSLKKGDKVVTTSGIYGEIVAIEKDTLLLEVDRNVRLRIEKAAVRSYAQPSEG